MKRSTVLKNIKNAIERVTSEIRGLNKGLTPGGSFYASGLSSEGYAGGYRQALYDIQNVLNGVQPNTRQYWEDWVE